MSRSEYLNQPMDFEATGSEQQLYKYVIEALLCDLNEPILMSRQIHRLFYPGQETKKFLPRSPARRGRGKDDVERRNESAQEAFDHGAGPDRRYDAPRHRIRTYDS